MFRGSSVPLASRHCSCRQSLLYQPAPALNKLRAPRSATVLVPAKQRICLVHAKVDYVASASDAHVLQLPLKQELTAAEVKKVFGFSNALKEKYTIGKVIGAGSFGVVREAVHKRTNVHYACKTIPKLPKKGRGTPRYLLKIQTEVDAMLQLGPSLDAVFLQDVFEDEVSVHLVMELCTGGGILDKIKQHNYTERRISQIMQSIIRFISQCHAKGIIYRDIKPDNFLFLTKDENSAIRATDFGLSIRHWPDEGQLKSRSGTPVYMAPEVILQGYDAQADMWSVGMLMYQLLTGTFPFWDSVANVSLQQAILVKKLDLDSSWVKQSMSEGARQLLKGLLVREPASRLTANQALEHPWIKDQRTAPATTLNGSVVQRLQRFATYGYLKQVVLKMIASDLADSTGGDKLGDDQSEAVSMVTALRELFKSLDTDASNTIEAKELADGLKAQGYNISQQELSQLMGRVDFDRNGTLDLEEFISGLIDWSELQKDGDWETRVDAAFCKLDSNGDGYIDLEELLAQLPFESEESYDGERLMEVLPTSETLPFALFRTLLFLQRVWVSVSSLVMEQLHWDMCVSTFTHGSTNSWLSCQSVCA
ncbi:hypothetical protein ABBQ32_004581 [Trebouxia sp. C0010 RCD-2024]